MATRRGILIGALAGGGLAVGYMLRPRDYPLPLTPLRGEVAFDAWIKIAGDGVVTVAVPQLEMGQGVTTLIPQIVAMELGADWRQIAVEPAPVSAHYANLVLAARWRELWMPLLPDLAEDPEGLIARRWAQDYRFDATADGTSLAAYEAPARAAAASARAMIAQAAAARWGVAWEECQVAEGVVAHEDKRLPLAALAAEAVRFDPPDPPPLRAEPPAERPEDFPIGAAPRYPRLDLPSKVDGSHVFAGDVRLPDLVYAAIRHGPIGESALLDYDKDRADRVRGLITLVRHKRWLAAVGTTWWAAEQALARIAPRFETHAAAESADIEQALAVALNTGEARRLHESGDAAALLVGRLSHQLRYEALPAIHATIETASATARFSDGQLELWVATQAPESARRAVADALGLGASQIVLYPMPAGGSFDRRLEHDHAVEAAIIARECGRPVQLVWSRWQEHVAGWPRTPAVAVLAARTDDAGRIAGWRSRIAAPASAREFGRRLFGRQDPLSARRDVADEADPLVTEGAVPPYDIAHLALDHVPAAIPLPTARMRGNAHGYTAFFNESFVDELAHLAGREPLAYRMAMLGKDPRLAECLQRVAALSEWGGGGDSSGQGIACHRIGHGRIAVVASARRSEMGVRVNRISAVADIGRIVNLDIARQQVEGGIVFGLGLALGSSLSYEEGLPAQGRLSALNLPVLADCPAIDVEFVTSDEDPEDPGELGVAAVAPAVANALFSATGLRFRRLPLLSEEY
ncbi:xanthine dehydrogenase [Novosphingobium sp. PC22D]|uniref:xanthine dehydrogenase family protein molybdopterin-binding subunit n=1 Tax=Novosphingobium sp. PC22D TaxID=1962403 RepID=UPI000BF02550|nr:molybdopterin cofactor-binding domain-containing protein [Novosphingobium sp. PC22D]PEQ14559.1 xanthine dehydrogenase [Novosphingobium sp. PC22D]